MAQPQGSMRTSLAKVRGFGSARSGTGKPETVDFNSSSVVLMMISAERRFNC